MLAWHIVGGTFQDGEKTLSCSLKTALERPPRGAATQVALLCDLYVPGVAAFTPVTLGLLQIENNCDTTN